MATEVLPDDLELRQARRRRALDEMAARRIDALLLGREANARYVAGAPRLWTAGSRPFGPGCVLVAATGDVHLVSTWDEGIPDDIPHENLLGITWNPGTLFAWLQRIDGLAGARRIGTDSLTPRFARVLSSIFPTAELVDAEPALQAARRIKTAEEVTAIRTAVAVAEGALAAAVDELRPGVSEHHLAAVFMEAMARQGVTTPATQRVAWVAEPGRLAGAGARRTVQADDLVTFDAGVVAGGYVGQVGRTWPASAAAAGPAARDLYRRADEVWQALLDACRPGAPCTDLLAAAEAAGAAAPPGPVAAGLGLGFDVPVVTPLLPRTAAEEHLAPGMVLAVTAHAEDGGRAVTRTEAVHVTADGPEVLTAAPRWQP